MVNCFPSHPPDEVFDVPSDNIFGRLKQRWLTLIMVTDSPLSRKIFKSDAVIREEKLKHLALRDPYIIHPLSKFRAWYEAYLFFQNIFLVFYCGLDIGFSETNRPILRGSSAIDVVSDFMGITDIIMTFRTGYFKTRESNSAEMRPMKIAKNYITSPFFTCDVLASFPQYLPFLFVSTNSAIYSNWAKGILNIMSLLRLIQMSTLVQILYRTAEYYSMKIRGVLFIISSCLVVIVIIHFLACMQFALPKFTRIYFAGTSSSKKDSWIYYEDMFERELHEQYVICFMKSSSYIFGVYLPLFYNYNLEEYILAITTFIVGKVMIALVWVMFAAYIISKRALSIKYYELESQLEAFVKYRRYPPDIRRKLKEYYAFKYQKNFMNEHKILSLLTDNLRREVNTHLAKGMIKTVSLFKSLKESEIDEFVTKLKLQIFLPSDQIMSAGAVADGVFFIYSGTVAVYSRAGKEVYHLRDGAMFGELSLVLRSQKSILATAIAIETTQVYKMLQKDFDNLLARYADIRAKIMKKSEKKRRMLLKIDHQVLSNRRSTLGNEKAPSEDD